MGEVQELQAVRIAGVGYYPLTLSLRIQESLIILKPLFVLYFPTLLENVTGYLYISNIFAVIILNYRGKCKVAY